MLVNSKTRWRLRADNLVFTVLFLAAVGLVAWLSTRYHLQADWTAGGRNSLSAASTELLGRLEKPVAITAYAREDELLRETIRDLVERYRRAGGDIRVDFVNPDEVPDRVRELGVAMDGELIVRYDGRTEHVQSHSEEALSNALQRLTRAGERWLVFLTGHGERAPLGPANHDLGDFGRHLEQRGFNIQRLNLAEQGTIPDNTTVLVVAGPQVDLLPGEAARVREYLEGGGNLLWLHDPGPLRGLGPVAEALGVEFPAGTIVDPTTRLFGIDHPAIVLVTGYPFHPVTRDFDLLTVFPQATAMATAAPGDWETQAILTTSGNAWAETGELMGEVRFEDDSDLPGPLDLGYAFTRERPATWDGGADGDEPGAEQRVAVIGDGDFLSNSFLGNGGNLDLGFNLMNWLASDDRLLAIPAKTAPDTSLTLGEGASLVIGFGFLFALPAGLLGTGIAIWMRRRKR